MNKQGTSPNSGHSTMNNFGSAPPRPARPGTLREDFNSSPEKKDSNTELLRNLPPIPNPKVIGSNSFVMYRNVAPLSSPPRKPPPPTPSETVVIFDLNQEADSEMERNKVLNELIATEKSYITDINFLINVYFLIIFNFLLNFF